MTPESHNSNGISLARQARFAEAAESFRQAIAARPDYVEAHFNFAKALKDLGRTEESIAAYLRTLELSPDSGPAWINFANVLRESGRTHAAIDAFQRAAGLQPNDAGVQGMLGRLLHETNRITESILHFRALAGLLPNEPEAHHALGVALHDTNQLFDAAKSYEKTLTLDPTHAHAAYGLGLIRLTQGDFASGWNGYDARRRLPAPRTVRDFPQPLWNGTALAGKRILIHAEQGLGDTLQFIRYVPMVTECGGKVIVQCPRSLVSLLERRLTISEVIEDRAMLPEFDVHCPLLTLPKIFGTTLETIPAPVPYLSPDPDRAAGWRDRIKAQFPDVEKFKNVGLVWSGSSTHRNDRNRSIAAAAFEPLARIPSIRLFSLQKAGSPPSTPLADVLIDYTSDLNDLADTAALVGNLDLVISVDTAVAHLAGAMGKPTWLLLPYATDWRWLLNRTDSPWYPTMRLFRQQHPGDWRTAIDQIIECLGNGSI